MGRVRRNIEVNGNFYWTLFDTGSKNTYITEEVARNFQTFTLKQVREISLGGKVHEITKGCFFTAKVEGYTIEIDAYVIDEIGKDEEGNEIKVVFGALAMQKWGIIPIPHEERLDMTNYPKEFVEYINEKIY